MDVMDRVLERIDRDIEGQRKEIVVLEAHRELVKKFRLHFTIRDLTDLVLIYSRGW